jgi:dihydrofolate reductase
MRKIIVGAQVSLDGVMQAPGRPTEDPTSGFRFGGWAMSYFSHESREEVDRLFGETFDLLLGRKTYEIFAAYWPDYDENGPAGEIAKVFNRITKYVVSGSGEVDTSWRRSELLRDIAEVKRLKEEDGPNLVTQGSTVLAHALLANDLVDEIKIFLIPVVLGGGKKLFADGSTPHGYDLIHSRVTSNGLVIAHYARAGEVRIGDAGFVNPGAAEAARQERMKRQNS